jgi:hypothetical protein
VSPSGTSWPALEAQDKPCCPNPADGQMSCPTRADPRVCSRSARSSSSEDVVEGLTVFVVELLLRVSRTHKFDVILLSLQADLGRSEACRIT